MATPCLLQFTVFLILQPWIESQLHTPDTCGVHNLHGMPGVLAGILSIFFAMFASTDTYKASLYDHYPAMASSNPQIDESSPLSQIEPGKDRSSTLQGGFQGIALLTTLALAIVAGLITGDLLHYYIYLQYFLDTVEVY